MLLLIARKKVVRNFIKSAFAFPTFSLQLKKHVFLTYKETHDILIH
jgi:hypothetical protein